MPMSDAPTVFKISRAGKVIHEGLSLAQVVEAIALNAILPTDHYWSSGMVAWDLVSSRQWTPAAAPTPAPLAAVTPTPVPVAKPAPVVAPTPAPSPAPVNLPNPAATSPAAPVIPRPVTPAPATTTTTPPSSPSRPIPPSRTPPPSQPVVTSLTEPVEKGYSPYVTYYRSDDNRWAFGIFGGIAHRNSWPKPLLLVVRILMLVSIVPAISYIGWGFTVMLLTPSLPTSKVRSYYDLNNGSPSRDSQDFSRILKLLALLFVLMVAATWFISNRF